MKTKSFRTVAAAMMTGLFLPQCIGASDIAVMMGPAARPLMFPQPGRLAPYANTAKPAPARPSIPWSQRLEEFSREVSAVAAWLKPSKAEETAPVEPPHPGFAKRAPEDIPITPALESAPGFSMAENSGPSGADPVLDRMLVTRAAGVLDVVLPGPRPAYSLRPVFTPRLEMPWVEGKGIRFRITYLDPPGLTWADSRGFHAQILDRLIDNDVHVPERYWKNFPLYFANDRVRYEIEVENTGEKTLTGALLTASQELFNMAGGKGPELAEPKTSIRLPSVKPGARTVVANSFFFSHGSHASISFEQTHVTVMQGQTTLSDAPQAGIADPPGE